MVRKTKEDKEKTRSLLLDAAEQVFMHQGVRSATLEQIARQAGLTRGAVYWHFENKCEIVKAMQERVKEPLNASLCRVLSHENPFKMLEEHYVNMLQMLEKDEHMQRVYFIKLFKYEQTEPFAEVSIYQKEKREEVMKKFDIVFEWAEKQKLLSPDFTPHKASIALYAYLTGLLNTYLRDKNYFNMQEQAAPLIRIFFRGISRYS